jgi:RNA polymerase sigma factor (sigma-70 family)
VTSLEQAFAATRAGDPDGFAAWVHMIEPEVFSSLRRFSASVDVEAVVQECLLRMWKLAPLLDLEGPNASLRYALRLARNLAVSEARRSGRRIAIEDEDLERLPEVRVEPDPVPDPRLRRIIMECIEKLPERPRAALRARLDDAGLRPDRELASTVRMKVNTFLQNIVRARKLVSECLRRGGVDLKEIPS